MIQVISTKRLTSNQRSLLDPELFHLQEYDAIAVSPARFTLPESPNNIIFTSQHAVRFFFRSLAPRQLHQLAKCYCVGKKTESLLLKKGLNVVKMAKNGEELANYLIKTVKNEAFLHICGNLTRPELPTLLKNNGISYKQLRVYNTQLNPRSFDAAADAILFFSPSGVASFTAKNHITVETVFCIGSTTAASVKPHTEKIILAQQQSVEGVVRQLADYYQSSIAN